MDSNCRIVAEIGLAHEGSLGTALAMSKAAIKAGAQIIKFQVHHSDEESSNAEIFRTNFSRQDLTRWDYWKRTAFTKQEWLLLKTEIEGFGGVFAASVFSEYSIDLMQEIGTRILKLGSGDLNNSQLLEKLADFDGTLLMSTGMAYESEILEAVNWLRQSSCASDSAILQCTSMYPTPLEMVGLNVMVKIMQTYGINSGLSDHSQGISASLMAITQGASYIEKHVVFSQEMFGPDVSSSITFEQLKFLRTSLDEFKALSVPVNKDEITKNLKSTREIFGRSLALKKSLPKGHTLKLEDFCLRKPAGGLKWENRLDCKGKILRKPYLIGEILDFSYFT